MDTTWGTIAPVRILIAEDYALWRQSICAMLREHPEVQLVGEAANGFEVVHKADELKPHLMLLDIGLPNLNGIEAAKLIRQVVPGIQILFISMNSDPDVVCAALSSGAKGYLLKADAKGELWLAIEAVLQGERYVSSGLRSLIQARATDSPELVSIPTPGY